MTNTIFVVSFESSFASAVDYGYFRSQQSAQQHISTLVTEPFLRRGKFHITPTQLEPICTAPTATILRQVYLIHRRDRLESSAAIEDEDEIFTSETKAKLKACDLCENYLSNDISFIVTVKSHKLS